MVQLYHKKTINIDRKTPNIKTKKGVKPLEFHTFSYGCLLFIYRYLLDFLEISILNIVSMLVVSTTIVCLTSVRTCLSTALCA